MQLLRILASSLLLASLALAQGGARPVHLAVVTIRDAATLDKLMALDLDLAGRNALELPVREVEVIADDAELQRMTAAGLRYRVEVRDLEKTIGDRLARYQMPMSLTPSVGQGAMGGHYTLAQMEAILDEFARKHPAICTQKVSLGKSHENRDIWMIKISDNVQVDENEPEVLYDALHHAREPLSMTTTLLFMDWLLSEYGKDPIATFIVDQRELYFVPCVNPDGYEYKLQQQPQWRRHVAQEPPQQWRKLRRRPKPQLADGLERTLWRQQHQPEQRHLPRPEPAE
jgi:murein tripeptide amidase MpaA